MLAPSPALSVRREEGPLPAGLWVLSLLLKDFAPEITPLLPAPSADDLHLTDGSFRLLPMAPPRRHLIGHHYRLPQDPGITQGLPVTTHPPISHRNSKEPPLAAVFTVTPPPLLDQASAPLRMLQSRCFASVLLNPKATSLNFSYLTSGAALAQLTTSSVLRPRLLLALCQHP